MVRQSNYTAELIETVSSLIAEAQAATDLVDEAAGHSLGINRTDLRCLGAVFQSGSISAGRLAEQVGLTRGAMTTAIDRLERAGYVRRVGDPGDGRGVRVEATSSAKRAVRQIWGPIGTNGLKLLKKYSDSELDIVRRFLDEYCKLQRFHAKRIRRLGTT